MTPNRLGRVLSRPTFLSGWRGSKITPYQRRRNCPNLPPNGHQTPYFEPHFKGIFLTVGCENFDAVPLPHGASRPGTDALIPQGVMHPTGKAAHLTGLPKTICPQSPGELTAPRAFNLSGMCRSVTIFRRAMPFGGPCLALACDR